MTQYLESTPRAPRWLDGWRVGLCLIDCKTFALSSSAGIASPSRSSESRKGQAMNRRQMIAATAATLIGSNARAATKRDHLIPQSIHVKESGGRVRNVPRGDGGRAFGPMQIWRDCWLDAAEWDRWHGGRYGVAAGGYEDCDDLAYAVQVFWAYTDRYAGVRAGLWARACVWNGGPGGLRKPAAQAYASDVQKIYAKIARGATK